MSDGRRGVFYVDSEELFVPSALATLARRRGGEGNAGEEGRPSTRSSSQSADQPKSTGRGRQSAEAVAAVAAAVVDAVVDAPSVVPPAAPLPAETDSTSSDALDAPDAALAAEDFYVVL